MNLLNISGLLCVGIFVAHIGGRKCQNNSGENFSTHQMKSLSESNKPNYFDQFLTTVMRKLDNVDRKLMENVKWQKETDSKLEKLFWNILGINWKADSSVNSFNQSESPFILDATKRLAGGRGGIAFDGRKMSTRKRRFWVLERSGTVKFTLAKNDLQTDTRLTITVFDCETIRQFFIDSSTETGTAFSAYGVVALVTMSSNNTDNSTGLRSSFALKFQRDGVISSRKTLYPTTFVTGEGRQVASFPEKNTRNYSTNSCHLMVISRNSGQDFNLTGTFVDIRTDDDYYKIYEIVDNAETTEFRYKTGNKGGFGKWGRTFLQFGRYSTVAVFFKSDSSGTGKGYEMMIE